MNMQAVQSATKHCTIVSLFVFISGCLFIIIKTSSMFCYFFVMLIILWDGGESLPNNVFVFSNGRDSIRLISFELDYYELQEVFCLFGSILLYFFNLLYNLTLDNKSFNIFIKVDNFIQYMDDQIPDFLAKSVIRNTKLSVCEVNLSEDRTTKLNIIKNRRKSQFQLPKSTFIRRQSYELKPTLSKITNPNKKQQQTQISQRYNKEQQQDLKIFKTHKSEHKLPSLSKCVVELKVKQNPNNLIRIFKEPSKPKLIKNLSLYRHVNQKNQIIRIKQESHINPEKQDKQKDRLYFIKNLILNSGLDNDGQSRHKVNISILVNKLRETQRRGRQSVNLLSRRVQRSPSELIANKLQYDETGKTNIKQEIMKKFSYQLGAQNKKKEQKTENSTRKKEENYVSGWNVDRQQISPLEYINTFE